MTLSVVPDYSKFDSIYYPELESLYYAGTSNHEENFSEADEWTY